MTEGVDDLASPDANPEVASEVEAKLAAVETAFMGQLLSGSANPPELLFHYTTAQGLLGIVRSNRLWASDVLYMNDSSEVEYGRSLIIATATDTAQGSLCEMARSLFVGMEHVLYPVGMMVGDGFYATCFCEDRDLLSQWRGYSGRVGGYSLGINTRELGRRWGERAPEQRFVLRRVIYDLNEQRDLVRIFLLQ